MKIGIIGAGSWGTALAVITNRAGADVTLWTRNSFVLESVMSKNRNGIYLPDVFLDPAIVVTDKMQPACDAGIVLLTVPSQHVRAICISMSDYIKTDVPIVICSKGIERGSLALMSEVVKSVLPENPIAILSGPNFALPAAKGQPTATTIACNDKEMAEKIMFAIGTSLFRPYWHDDMVGVQIGGAVKNVIAIACGIAKGKNLGENAIAALITRSMSEMKRLTIAKGGNVETLMGLSGLGDLILTCTSDSSRNTGLGVALAGGETIENITTRRRGAVAEGVATAESVAQLAEMLKIDMPICKAVYDVLYRDAPLDDAIASLLERPFTREI
jgi:glycerol-3-phosphate dehydrogenase (NAD(P)+)